LADKLKDQYMKKISLLALAGLLFVAKSAAISLDDIQLWTGSGTNRAALVIEWNTPEVLNYTTVPAPVANKTLVWGYRFNGSATGTQMFNAIVAANPGLYAVEDVDPTYGTSIDAIGFSLNGAGLTGLTDGTITNLAGTFTKGILVNPSLNVDGTYSLNRNDLFWSGFTGPYWQLWNELGDNGGFLNSPNRGTNEFWDADAYSQGQWASSYSGLDELPLTNGSWIGFSISAAGYDSNPGDPAYDAFNFDEQAPPSPDGTYTAYVCNTNDFAVAIINTNNIDTATPYNNPAAVLGRPTLRFYDPYDDDVTDRVSIIDDPYNVTPDGHDVITEIKNGGEITVQLGRKIYADPSHPYGIDLIVYGNSFFSASGLSSSVSDATDLSTALLGSGIYGHPTTVSVSPDGTNWYTYATTSVLFPDNAYRWDDTNAAWTDEEMNPTKPVNPAIYAAGYLSGQTIAGGLDQFAGAAGGTGYDLKESGFPWIQYVRIQPQAGTYTVIDAIAAVNPVVVGDALSITPGNLTAGVANLDFQNPADSSQNLIAVNFDALSNVARVSTVALTDFSSYRPVIGDVSSAYKITVKPSSASAPVTYVADVGLRVSTGYTGSGNDLRVYQWKCTNWITQPFSFNSTNNEVLVKGLTNLSALVVSQIIPPLLTIQSKTNSFTLQFIPVPNCVQTLERSTDLSAWTPITTVTPTNALPVALQDNTLPVGKAFYRLSVDVP
jgi:hypothetical protein